MKRETAGGILSVLLTWGVMLIAKDIATTLIVVVAFALNVPLAFFFSRNRSRRAIALLFLHYCYVTLATFAVTLIAFIVYFFVTYKKIGG